MPKPPLNAEQARIIQTKEVSLNHPIDELLGILVPVAQWDAAGDSSRKTLGCSGAALLAGGVVLLFAHASIPAAALVVAAIVVLIVWNRKKAGDISDNLRLCAVPMLVALREDFGSEPVELKLDLRPPTWPAKQTSKAKVDKVTTTIFSDPWMYGQGMLHDGSRLRWNVDETIVEKSYWKREGSGKSKLKKKQKKRVSIEADLTLKAKTYGEKQTLHGEAKLKRDTIDPIPCDAIINVIADLYKKAQQPAAS